MEFSKLQATLHMMDSMGPGKLVCHMQSLSYTYDTLLICMALGPSISSVIGKSLAYSGPSYTSLFVSRFLPYCIEVLTSQLLVFAETRIPDENHHITPGHCQLSHMHTPAGIRARQW